jgi:hypothetical protein
MYKYYLPIVSTMLTDKQVETFRKLRAGQLTASEKADFYYRMLSILRKNLEGLEDISCLMEEMPDNHLKKITKTSLMEAATAAMKLTEMLLWKIDPAPLSECEDGKYQVIRYIDIKHAFPGLPDQRISAKAIYEPDDEEVEFLKKLGAHADGLKALTESGGRHSGFVHGPEQINEEFISQTFCSGEKCKIEIVPVIDRPKSNAVIYPLIGNYWGDGKTRATKEKLLE